MKNLFLILCLLLGGCQVQNTAQRATPSAAKVGVNLDDLSKSLGDVRGHVDAAKTGLSKVDDKAVRIEEAIKNW